MRNRLQTRKLRVRGHRSSSRVEKKTTMRIQGYTIHNSLHMGSKAGALAAAAAATTKYL